LNDSRLPAPGASAQDKSIIVFAAASSRDSKTRCGRLPILPALSGCQGGI
jgi:hypothetical protein